MSETRDLNSAILTGGLDQLLAALVGAALLATWIGGWQGVRVAAFFVGWQAFTPLRAWYFDLPALIVCTLVLEGLYQRLARRRKVAASE